MYIICMYTIYIYIWIVRYVTFNARLRLEQRHKVVTSHIAVSSSYAKTGFISLSIAVYQFLVHNIGKSHIKFIAALKKLLLDSYPSCALFLLSHSIEQFILFSKSETPQVRYCKNPTPIMFSELALGNSLSVWLKPHYEQHVIKFIAIYCYSTINQVSEA